MILRCCYNILNIYIYILTTYYAYDVFMMYLYSLYEVSLMYNKT